MLAVCLHGTLQWSLAAFPNPWGDDEGLHNPFISRGKRSSLLAAALLWTGFIFKPPQCFSWHSRSLPDIFSHLWVLLSLGCYCCRGLIWDPHYLFIFLVMDFVCLVLFQTQKKLWGAFCRLTLQRDAFADSVGLCVLCVCVFFSPAAPVICFLSYLFNPLCECVRVCVCVRARVRRCQTTA